MLLGIYLSGCYLRGIDKSPTALFQIKKSETAPISKELNSFTRREGDQKPAKATDPEAWRMVPECSGVMGPKFPSQKNN